MAELVRVGTITVPVYVVDIDYEPTEYEIDVTHDCSDLELNERCIGCLDDYYEGKRQFEEDQYRDRD